jgi:hypothetical protein
VVALGLNPLAPGHGNREGALRQTA